MYKWLTVVRGMGWQSQQQYVTAVHVMQFVLAAKDILVTGDIHLYQWTWTMKWCPEIQKEAIAIVSPSSFVHTCVGASTLFKLTQSRFSSIALESTCSDLGRNFTTGQ